MVVSHVPERSLTQRLDALERANEVRTYRARLKKNLKAGRITIDQILRNPHRLIETMKIMELMLEMPKYGRVKVSKALTQCRISPSKTIGGLTERQLEDLLSTIRMNEERLEYYRRSNNMN